MRSEWDDVLYGIAGAPAGVVAMLGTGSSEVLGDTGSPPKPFVIARWGHDGTLEQVTRGTGACTTCSSAGLAVGEQNDVWLGGYGDPEFRDREVPGERGFSFHLDAQGRLEVSFEVTDGHEPRPLSMAPDGGVFSYWAATFYDRGQQPVADEWGADGTARADFRLANDGSGGTGRVGLNFNRVAPLTTGGWLMGGYLVGDATIAGEYVDAVPGLLPVVLEVTPGGGVRFADVLASCDGQITDVAVTGQIRWLVAELQNPTCLGAAGFSTPATGVYLVALDQELRVIRWRELERFPKDRNQPMRTSLAVANDQVAVAWTAGPASLAECTHGAVVAFSPVDLSARWVRPLTREVGCPDEVLLATDAGGGLYMGWEDHSTPKFDVVIARVSW